MDLAVAVPASAVNSRLALVHLHILVEKRFVEVPMVEDQAVVEVEYILEERIVVVAAESVVLEDNYID